MLTWNFSHTLDAKNRLFIPAKHREQLGGVFVITKSVDPCLCVYSMEEWKNYTDKLESLPRTRARKIARFIYSNATEVTPDAQGRVLIPAELLKYAGIEKNAVILGCGSRAEIWSEDRYEKETEDENIADIEQEMLEGDI